MRRPSPSPDALTRAFTVTLASALACLAIGSPRALGQIRAPGPESFAKAPTTPLELWGAADYLIRVGQPEQAAPYLRAFIRSRPDDAVLLQIRDRFGAGSV